MGISTHVWSQWVTKLCAGKYPPNQRRNHQFLKVIILFAFNPHKHTSSLNAVLPKNSATRPLLSLPFIVSELVVSAATSSFFFHKENLQLQRASYDFPPILITVTFQVPTAGVCV